MMRARSVIVPATTTLKSSCSVSSGLRRLLRKDAPIFAESHSVTKASTKTSNGNLTIWFIYYLLTAEAIYSNLRATDTN